MKPSTCPYEEGVARAVRSSLWTDALREHAADCRHCGDTAAIAKRLKAIADLDRSDGAAPDSELIWLRSQSIEKDLFVERTLWPVQIVETIGVAATFTVAAAGLLSQGPDLIRALPGAIGAGRDAATAWLADTEAALPVVPALAWLVGLLVLVLIVFFSMLDPVPSED